MQSIFELFRGALRLYSKNTRSILPFLVYSFFTSITSQILLWSWPFFEQFNFIGEFSFITLEVGLMILSFWFSLSLLKHLLLLAQGATTTNTTAVLKQTRPLILSGLWILFLYILAIISGLLLLIIPGIILSVWFTFCLPILLDKGLRGTAALRESHALISGKTLPVLLRIIGLSLIILLLAYLISFAVGKSVSGILAFTPLYYSSSLQAIRATIFTVVSLIVSLGFAPLTTSIAVLLYEDLKRLRVVLPTRLSPTDLAPKQ